MKVIDPNRRLTVQWPYDNHPLARAPVIALRCFGLRRVLVRGWAARHSRCFRV